MIKDNFMYTNIFNYFFGIITVNNGKSDEKIDRYLFIIYIFITISYKLYNKIREMKKKRNRKKSINKNFIIINKIIF